MIRWKIHVAASLVVVAALSALGAAQELPPAASGKAFAASVRVNKSGTTQTNINRTPGGVTFTNLPLTAILQFAYGINQPSRLAKVPDWANNERFDIVARGAVTSLEDRRVMLQALLVDRFKLVAHTEQRNIPISTLVLARSDGKLGPTLKRSAVDGRGAGAPDVPDGRASIFTAAQEQLGLKRQAGNQPEDVIVFRNRTRTERDLPSYPSSIP